MDDGRRVAVELNDAGLALARVSDGRAEASGAPSPGVAVIQDGRVLLGAEAAARQRVTPLHAQNRFWQSLGLERLATAARGFATQADLAHAHLSAVLAPAVREGAADLLIAVPPGYTREQLGLLVGIASECGVTVRGLVDQGLAACATLPPAPHMLHLDLQLHQATATLVEASRAEGVQRRARYELLPGLGVVAFHQALAAAVATTFVRETRFDPLHEATTEQRLHDQLPGWLDSLGREPEIPVEIEIGAQAHRITLQRATMIAAVEGLASELLRLVQGSRPAGMLLQVCVTPRVAAVPGLLERLATLRDVMLVTLEPAAAAVGALQAAAAIVREPDAIALVHRLPLRPPAEGSAPASPSTAATDPEAVPTHVLYRGRAWPITRVPLTLGWSVGPAARGLPLPAGVAGVSRSHCTVGIVGSEAVVEDHSTYGTFVNDERVGGRVALRVGDVLRLGAPGVTLELIRVLGSA